MFVDPIAVAADAPNPAFTFARIQSNGYTSDYLDAVNNYQLKVSHTPGSSSDRHYIQITQTKSVTDATTGLTSLKSASVSLSFAVPKVGFSIADMQNLYLALKDTLADAEATTTRLLSWQS